MCARSIAEMDTPAKVEKKIAAPKRRKLPNFKSTMKKFAGEMSLPQVRKIKKKRISDVKILQPYAPRNQSDHLTLAKL